MGRVQRPLVHLLVVRQRVLQSGWGWGGEGNRLMPLPTSFALGRACPEPPNPPQPTPTHPPTAPRPPCMPRCCPCRRPQPRPPSRSCPPTQCSPLATRCSHLVRRDVVLAGAEALRLPLDLVLPPPAAAVVLGALVGQVGDAPGQGASPGRGGAGQGEAVWGRRGRAARQVGWQAGGGGGVGWVGEVQWGLGGGRGQALLAIATL